MKIKKCVNKLSILGLVLLASLALAFTPGQIWALDTDRDGLDDSLEASALTLNPFYELWGGGSTVPGEDSGFPEGERLASNRPDLFVIVRLTNTSNFDPTVIEDYFAFAAAPVASGGLGFKVWVLEETGQGSPLSDRQFSDSAVQKAALVIEDLDIDGIKQGVAQYASIMTEGKGIARVYSQRVVNSIDATCFGADSCEDIDVSTVPEIKFKHLQWVVIHEVMHVLFSLDNSLRNVEGYHLTRGEYVMMPAVVITDKKGAVTYHIPGEFSTSAADNWQFYQ